MDDNGEGKSRKDTVLSRMTISIVLISRFFGIVSNNRAGIGLFR